MKNLRPHLIGFLLASTMPHAFAADVIDSSLKLRLNFDAAPVNDVVADTSPAAAHPATNLYASWRSAENGRNGVMDFKAPIPNRITVPAIPALNSTQGTISFWMKSPGNLIRGDFAAGQDHAFPLSCFTSSTPST